jgi:hypothetical protein
LKNKKSQNNTSSDTKINAEKNSSLQSFFTTRRMIWICLLISFVFYGNSIKNGYSMDDEYVTSTDQQKNELAELGAGGIGKIFTSHSFKDGKQNYEYRPISIYSFAIEWSLFKESENRVHFSHAINVILYAFVGIVLFQLLQVIFQGKASLFSAITVILFMIHPIHSEVVDSIKNRDELLSLIFAILAAIQTFHWVDKKEWWRVVLACVFILFSLLSKKSNLPFVISIPLMIYFFRDVKLKTIGIIFLLLFFVKIGFNLVKNHWMNLDETSTRVFSTFENPLFDLGFAERIPMFFYTNWLYIQKLILPYPLAFYYGYDAIPLVGYTDWQFYLGLLIMAIALYFAIKGFRSKSKLSFGILFFYLAIGGVANLLSPMVGIFAERFAFSASIGFCIVLVYVFSKWKEKEFLENKLTFSVVWPLLLLILPCLIFTVNRNKAWESKKSLYLADIDNVSKSAKANSLLGSEYQVEAMKLQKEGNVSYNELMQKVDSAIYFYDQSLKIYKNYESNLNNKGVLLYTFKYDYFQALSLFQHSVSVNSKYKEGYLNCGNSLAKLAEGFNDFMLVAPAGDSSLTITDKEISSFEKTYNDKKIYQAIAIIKQFELNIREFYIKGNKQELKNKILGNCQDLEGNSEYLKMKNFFQQVQNILSKSNSNELVVQSTFSFLTEFKSSILIEIAATNGIGKEKIKTVCLNLRKKYVSKAKTNFKKVQEIAGNDKNLFNIMLQFARITQDYEWLAEINLEYISKFPKEYHGTNYSELINDYVFQKNTVKAEEYCNKSIKIEMGYIQTHKNQYLGEHYVRMANAFLTLKNSQKAIENFKKGAEEFKREREFLKNKVAKTEADVQRIDILTRELQKLKQFKEKLQKKGNDR